MCAEINVIRNGEVIQCDTVGQLAAALGVSLSAITRYADPKESDCLCSAKWGELGARRATEDEGFPFPYYIIEQPPA